MADKADERCPKRGTMAVDPVLWCLCADLLTTDPPEVMRWGWLSHLDDVGSTEAVAILRAAECAVFPPNEQDTLRRVAGAVVVSFGLPDDFEGGTENERRLRQRVRAWCQDQLSRLPPPTGVDHEPRSHPQGLDDYKTAARQWYEAHREMLQEAYSDWASPYLHPEEDDPKIDFERLIAALAGVRKGDGD